MKKNNEKNFELMIKSGQETIRLKTFMIFKYNYLKMELANTKSSIDLIEEEINLLNDIYARCKNNEEVIENYDNINDLSDVYRCVNKIKIYYKKELKEMENITNKLNFEILENNNLKIEILDNEKETKGN